VFSPGEALQAFQWFDVAGGWPELFSAWERYLVIYVGAAAMWLIAKRLKKRHQLKVIYTSWVPVSLMLSYR
jgi:microsomal prostaglandin-E synthase 2